METQLFAYGKMFYVARYSIAPQYTTGVDELPKLAAANMVPAQGDPGDCLSDEGDASRMAARQLASCISRKEI